MAKSIQRQTEAALRDLHARESMRLGWYRQVQGSSELIKHLRERKAQHQAFLLELLRRRDLAPAWYSRYFYYLGHLFGLVTAPLPDRWVRWMENTLEFWILMRYERYLRQLRLHFNLRSMIEAVQLHRIAHNEPGEDVLHTLERFYGDQQQLVQR